MCKHCGRDLVPRPQGKPLPSALKWTFGIFGALFLLGLFVDKRTPPGSTANSSSGERAETLRAVVVSADERCSSVTRTCHRGTDPNNGQQFWNVSCADGGDFAVTIERGGSTRVMSCAL